MLAVTKMLDPPAKNEIVTKFASLGIYRKATSVRGRASKSKKYDWPNSVVEERSKKPILVTERPYSRSVPNQQCPVRKETET